jgi:acyl-coenzyme A thioesterase PaaI-like protein
MRKLPGTRSCFVCGESNPIGLKLRLETDGQIVQTHFVPKPEHVGFKQTVHGGMISTLLDEVMVWACGVHTKRFAYCVELVVRFLQTIRPGESITAVGQLVANRRGRLFETKGELRNGDGIVVATASGKYLPIKPALAAELAADFVGDPKTI